MERPYQFLVLQDFEAVVNGHLNQYHAGHPYTVREGSTWDDLEAKVPGWVADGKVVLL